MERISDAAYLLRSWDSLCPPSSAFPALFFLRRSGWAGGFSTAEAVFSSADPSSKLESFGLPLPLGLLPPADSKLRRLLSSSSSFHPPSSVCRRRRFPFLNRWGAVSLGLSGPGGGSWIRGSAGGLENSSRVAGRAASGGDSSAVGPPLAGAGGSQEKGQNHRVERT